MNLFEILVESRDTNQSIYNEISEIEAKVHQNKVENTDVFRTTDTQQVIHNLKPDLIETNLCRGNTNCVKKKHLNTLCGSLLFNVLVYDRF